MALKIRMARGGTNKRPFYRIVIANSRSPRDGRFLEKIGTYNPLLAKDNPQRMVIDLERAKHWMATGAKPSERVETFLRAAGVISGTKVYPKRTKLGKRKDRKAAAEAGAAGVAPGATAPKEPLKKEAPQEVAKEEPKTPEA